MDSGVLTLVDVIRIQPFVFASNRLKDIAAGSAMVAAATDRTELARMCGPGRVVFAAGGNALLAFPPPANATHSSRDFAGVFSRRLLDEFPGLDVEILHVPFGVGGWGDAFLQAQAALEARKLARFGGGHSLGLSVTAECVETRQVAAEVVLKDGRWHALSATTARRRSYDGAARQWTELLNGRQVDGRSLDFPLDIDRLGRDRGDMSLVGVVHVDGNGIGAAVANWVRTTARRALGNLAFQEEQGRLSSEISALGQGAMRSVLDSICGAIRPVQMPDGTTEYQVVSNMPGRGFTLDQADGSLLLPIRPVLVAGDDITFVCDGRLALTLARKALEAFASASVPSFGEPQVGACAGVAIVKSHAPFARAYELAEELCRQAKRRLRHQTPPFDGEVAAIDWHVGHLSTTERLERMRDREYKAGGLALTLRPYPLGRPDKPQTFAWLDDTVLGASAEGFLGSAWQRHRNKIKALREIARSGPDAVNQAIGAWRVTAGEEAATLPGAMGDGFAGGATTLLDATELVDLHLPLA